MNDKRYRVLHGSFGAFTVHGMEGYYADKRSIIKVYVPPDNVVIEQMVVDKLITLQKEKYFPIDKVSYFLVRGKQTRHPITKTKTVEFVAETTIAPAVALDWLINNAGDIPLEAETLEMGKEGWSVGPCIVDKGVSGSKWGPLPGRYVKVRFNKMSIPYYLTPDNQTWVKDLTRQTIERDRHMFALSSSIMEFFEKNQTEIIARAGKRPFNKSGIAEYDAPTVNFFNKTGNRYVLMFHQGASNAVDKSKLASPDYEPVVTLSYNRQYGDNSYKSVIVIAEGDKLMEVSKFTSDKNNNYHGWKPGSVWFYEKDIVEIDSGDEYVKERAIRALRSKL